MGAAVNEIGEPLRRATAAEAKPGCKGPSCPFFDVCQGLCAERAPPPRLAPDGGIYIRTP